MILRNLWSRKHETNFTTRFFIEVHGVVRKSHQVLREVRKAFGGSFVPINAAASCLVATVIKTAVKCCRRTLLHSSCSLSVWPALKVCADCCYNGSAHCSVQFRQPHQDSVFLDMLRWPQFRQLVTRESKTAATRNTCLESGAHWTSKTQAKALMSSSRIQDPSYTNVTPQRREGSLQLHSLLWFAVATRKTTNDQPTFKTWGPICVRNEARACFRVKMAQGTWRK